MHSVLRKMLAMTSKTGCLFTLTLRTGRDCVLQIDICTLKLPHSVLVMPSKIAVGYSDFTSDLVYPAALVPHAFSPGRDVSYAWQNRVPLYTHPSYWRFCVLQIDICTMKPPHLVLVILVKIAVGYSDLTSGLVYLAALVSYAFSPCRDVSYVWQNQVPPCTHLA